MPNITGSISNFRFSVNNNNTISDDHKWGALSDSHYVTSKMGANPYGSEYYIWDSISFNASKSNAIYGTSVTVQPPALTTNYVIKY